MQNNCKYFRIYPKVVKTNQKSTITVEPLFEHNRFKDNSEYEINCYPADIPYDKNGKSLKYFKKIKPIDGVITITQLFEGEQEYIFIINEIVEGKEKSILRFHVYSVEEDLFERSPFKGDMHMHSFRSDGSESPAYVAASCRKIGLDFMALTDHGQYKPSIESQEAFKAIDVDLRIYRGEEVHPPENPLHIINFGGSFSVNELFKDNDKYHSEVNELKTQLGDIPENVDEYEYASSVWVFNKIREAEGLGIYCHPYWSFVHRDCKQGYYISSGLISHLFDMQPYDAFELLGGYSIEEADSNTLQVARYNEERAKGQIIPIVGVTDAHGCDNGQLFGWYYTIVFSPSAELPELIHNIKDLYSVAVEALPGCPPKVYGPFRLVKFALFLIREVMPAHDAMCFEEGRLMLDYISGDSSASNRLKEIKGQTAAYMNRIYGK